jgi:hypothetical protein
VRSLPSNWDERHTRSATHGTRGSTTSRRSEHTSTTSHRRSSRIKEHYDTLGRIRAGFAWSGSQANRWIWGNGEQGTKLLTNFVILALIVFPLIFAAVGGIQATSGKVTTIDYVLLSIDSATSYSGLQDERDPLSGREGLQHDKQGEPD